MAQEIVKISSNEISEIKPANEQFLQVRVGSQLFGIPVIWVRDVLKPYKITRIPLSAEELLGFINLRGRIVTVIDMRRRLGITENADVPKKMFVVIEAENDLYSLQVDAVLDTKTLLLSSFENNPENMPAAWKSISRGVFKLDKELMIVLDVTNIVKL